MLPGSPTHYLVIGPLGPPVELRHCSRDHHCDTLPLTSPGPEDLAAPLWPWTPSPSHRAATQRHLHPGGDR